MTTQDITALLGGIAAVATAIGLPTYLRMRGHTSTLTPASVAQMFREERDRLQTRLDGIQTRHAKEIAEAQDRAAKALAATEESWRRQHEVDQAQIKNLQDEIAELYRRLYQPPPER